MRQTICCLTQAKIRYNLSSTLKPITSLVPSVIIPEGTLLHDPLHDCSRLVFTQPPSGCRKGQLRRNRGVEELSGTIQISPGLSCQITELHYTSHGFSKGRHVGKLLVERLFVEYQVHLVVNPTSEVVCVFVDLVKEALRPIVNLARVVHGRT